MAKPNGRHPLPLSLLVDTADIRFSEQTVEPTAEARTRVAGEVHEFAAQARLAVPHLAPAEIESFIASRDPESQAMMDPAADLTFLHTTPMTLGARPWVIHVETLVTFFEPFLGQFRTWDIDVDRQPVFHLVRQLLRSPACRGIYTHIERSRRDLPVLFRDPALAAKVTRAPLGMELPLEVTARVPEAIARRNAKGDDDEIVFLYTNSWHQHPASFYVRGGHELMQAFAGIRQRHPQRPCRLIIRSALPETLGPQVIGAIRSLPGVTVIEEWISDDRLYDLLLEADVFVLPSANLHTISLLRAMNCGAAILTADVFAIDEFVTDGDTALIASGRQGVTYREDIAQGLLRERSEPLFDPQGAFNLSLQTAMERLLCDHALRARLRTNAAAAVAKQHRIGPWREAFYSFLRKAAA